MDIEVKMVWIGLAGGFQSYTTGICVVWAPHYGGIKCIA